MAVVGLLVVLLALVGGMLAYDSSRKDVIAKGVTVRGIDVGGLTTSEARDRLRSQLADPLRQPVVARYRDRRFTLTPERARVAVDVEASVQRALDRSRSGSVITRTVRGLTGGRVDADVDADISYDRSAISSLVERVGSKLERPAVDADVEISTAGVTPKKARKGLKVKKRVLSRAVRRKLVSTSGSRTLRIQAQKIKPEVTTDELAEKYPSVIVINRSAFTLRLYENLEPVQDYRIAVGMAGLETPEGLYNIQNKQVNPYWNVPDSDWAGSLAGTTVPPGPSNPLKSRWMGIYNGAGIHGTDAIYSLGTAASHGCIRMAVPDVEALFDRVDVGTPVYIG